jgi:hypothetical protein
LTNTPCRRWRRWNVEAAIGGRLDDHGLEFEVGYERTEQRTDVARLPQRKRAASGGGAQAHVRLEVEELADGIRKTFATRRAGSVLQAHRGLVQELADDALGEGLDGLTGLVVEPRKLGCEPFALLTADLLGTPCSAPMSGATREGAADAARALRWSP